jgi:hypothetical protein
VLSGKAFTMDEGITLCFRINSSLIQQSSQSFLVVKHKESIDESWALFRPNGLIKFANQLYTYSFNWETFHWHHICLLYASNSSLKLIIDGLSVEVTKLTDIVGEVPKDIFVSGSLTLGSNTFGQFRDLHIWGRLLDRASLAGWLACKPGEEGDVFSWDGWTSTAPQGRLLQGEPDSCTQASTGFVDLISQRQMTFDESAQFCTDLGGELYVPDSEEELMHVLGQLEGPGYDRAACNNRAYIGLRKQPTGAFYRGTEGPVAEWLASHWHPLAPNGGSHQPCVVVNLTNHLLDDVACDSLVCSICEYKTRPVFSTRGLCAQEDSIRWKFKLFYLPGKRYIFFGIGPTAMIYNSSSMAFNVIDIFTRDTLASRTLPTGTVVHTSNPNGWCEKSVKSRYFLDRFGVWSTIECQLPSFSSFSVFRRFA